MILDKISLYPKRLFLLDGLGAFLTAFFLGVVLVTFEDKFGMPQKVLYAKNNWRPYLKIIAVANLLYCCLTFGLVIFFYSKLTQLGLIYFLLEIFIIINLAIIELKVAYR